MTQLLPKIWVLCWDLWNIREEWEQKVLIQKDEETIRCKVAAAIHLGFSDLPAR